MAAIARRSPLTSFGISMLGPALLKFGSEAQKKKYLPEIARGKIRCAKDIRNLAPAATLPAYKPRPRIAGDHYLVNGQEGVDQLRRRGGLDFLPGADVVRVEAQGDKASCCSDMASPGVVDQADPADQRQFAVLRDVLRQCEGAQGPACRRAQPRLDVAKYLLGHEARDDQRHGGLAGGGGSLGAAVGPVEDRYCAPKLPRSTSIPSPSPR
jgi:hypothetical protein